MENKHEFNTQHGFDACLTISTNPVYSNIRVSVESRLKSFSPFFIHFDTNGINNHHCHLMLCSQQIDLSATFEFNQAITDAHDIMTQYENMYRLANTDMLSALSAINEALKIRDFIFAATAISLFDDPEKMVIGTDPLNELGIDSKKSCTLMECVLHFVQQQNAINVYYDEAQLFYTTLLNRIVSQRENKAKFTVEALVEKVAKQGQALNSINFGSIKR